MSYKRTYGYLHSHKWRLVQVKLELYYGLHKNTTNVNLRRKFMYIASWCGYSRRGQEDSCKQYCPTTL